MNNVITTFHGAVYGKKVTRKESDLPADLTNASAATRRVYEPTVPAAKQTTEHKSKPPKKIAHKRISSSGDELQNQVTAGWVNVNLSLMAVTDLIHLAKKLTKGVGGLHTLKLDCFPKEYDRLEAEALKQRCKPKYSLAGEDHQTLVKSTVELACNPKLKGKIAFAIKEALANAAALQELTIGLNLPSAIWKALGVSMSSHQHLQVLSLAGSGIGDATLQALGEGLRSNQTIAELNLSGCSITDEGVRVLASTIKAKAAEADVQAWHEGLREYPDLSLEPHLRRQQFRARNREIRGRVVARCGGLQILHLAENKITDNGADLLLEALAMDHSMALLDLSANQLTMPSGKAFSKLMRKHKGLLRIDLRGNAQGMSGVLEMKPKGCAETATALKPMLDSASSGVLGEAQQPSQAALVPSKDLLLELYALHQHDVTSHAVAVSDQSNLRSARRAASNEYVEEQKGVNTVMPQKASRKGLVPVFSPEGQQHTSAGTGKENQSNGKDTPAKPTCRSKRRAEVINLSRAKPAGRKAQTEAMHVRQPSAARTASFEFEKIATLQSQPAAHLSQFVPAAVASHFEPQHYEEAAAASFSQHGEAGKWQASALQNATVESATFGDWNSSLAYASQALGQSVLPDNSTAFTSERPRTAGIAGPARRTVSFQEHDSTVGADHSRGLAGNAVDLASDPAYVQGISQAWREVDEAEDLGRQRAAADFEDTLHQMGAPLAADYAPESAVVDALHEEVGEAAADLTQAAADRKQPQRARPDSAYPAGLRSVRQSSGATTQQALSHSRTGFRASITDRATLSTEATPQEATSAGYNTASRSAAASGWPDQAAAAAAAMEVAKMNVWKAEVMMEVLKCSLQGAAADRRRAEAKAAELAEENQRLRLASTQVTASSTQPRYEQLSNTGLKAGNRQKACLHKKHVVRTQKRKGKAAVADAVDDAAEAVLQGQQQVLGDLSQVIRSLDELVTDIEDTSAVTADRRSHIAHPIMSYSPVGDALHQSEQQQQHSHPSMTDVIADVSRQLSMKFDLHDNLVDLANT